MGDDSLDNPEVLEGRYLKITVFTDAHIDSRERALEVARFLETKNGKIICLGDLFDGFDDYRNFGKLLPDVNFIWIKGNHEYWMHLPEFYRSGRIVFAHGHTLLPTRHLERLFTTITPLATRIGAFQGILKAGRTVEDAPPIHLLKKLLVDLADFLYRNKKELFIIGHLHNFLVTKKFIVIPKFPLYAEISGKRLIIKDFYAEVSRGKTKYVAPEEGHRREVIAEITLPVRRV